MSLKAFAAVVAALALCGGCAPLDRWNARTSASYVPLANGCPEDRPILWGPDDTGRLYCEAEWYDPDDPTHMYEVR